MNQKTITFFDKISDKATTWIGSTGSIIVHTIFFALIFVLYLFGISLDVILLLLTTIVSLEAIYLAIFIQRAVNKQSETLEDVEESVEDIEESLEDVEESIEEDDKEDEKMDMHIHQQLEEILAELKKRKNK
jgi:ABC-type multidrug transport system fused ATPase/permease subunit